MNWNSGIKGRKHFFWNKSFTCTANWVCLTLVSKVLFVCQPSCFMPGPKMSQYWNVEFLQWCCHLTSFLCAYRLIQYSRSLSNNMRDERRECAWDGTQAHNNDTHTDLRNALIMSQLIQRHSFIDWRCSWSVVVMLIQTKIIFGSTMV